ncbi:hypothetical protein D3C87_351470 [compost metagenome]
MVKSMKKSMFSMGFMSAITLSAMLFAVDANAANDVAELAGTVQGNIKAVKGLIVSAAYLIGVFLFAGGLYMIYKDSKQPGQDHAKKGFISLVIGACLLILPTMVDYMSGSLGGGDVSSSSLKNDADF